MLVTPFGSCRVEEISDSSKLNKLLSYTHCTKEVIQLIKFINGDIKLNEPDDRYCLGAYVENNKDVTYDHKFKELYDDTDVFVIEICSMKKYKYNDKYLTNLSVDTRLFNQTYKHTPEHIRNNTKIEIQSDEEIENDILEIQKLIYPRPMIIVSHVNVIYRGHKLEKRDYLINLLENICKKHDIMFINPTRLLLQFEQHDLIEPDLGHFYGITKHIVHGHIDTCVKYLKYIKRFSSTRMS